MSTIPGVPTDGLKLSDLLWSSILNKPLSFPPSAHSHLASDLPANIAFRDQANTFRQNQTVQGSISASNGLISTGAANASITLIPTYGAGSSVIDFAASGSTYQDARIASGIGSVSNIVKYTGGPVLTERMRVDGNGVTSNEGGILLVDLPWSSSAGVGLYRFRLIDLVTGKTLHDRTCTVPDETNADYEDLV